MGRAARWRSNSTVTPPTRCSRFTRSRARISRPSRPARTRRADARHQDRHRGGGADEARPPRVRGEESGLLSTFLSQMVNGIIQLINFAHGEIFMVGAYGALFMFTYVLPSAWQQQWYLILPPMLLAAAAVSVLVAVAMERFAYRPLRAAPRLATLITALGVSVALQEAGR